MSTIEAETPVEQPPPEAPAPVAEATKDTATLFKYSAWLHVGEGSEECEARFSGRCAEEGHFHAWCRLANGFQIRDIAEKARAAKARRIRALKDPESDASVVLAAELDELRDDPELKAVIVEEIVAKDYLADFQRAQSEVDEDERFELIDQHQEEYQRQVALPEDQRDSDSFEQAKKIIDEYEAELSRASSEIVDPKRASFMEREVDDLLKLIRKDRIEAAGNEAYLHTYNYWQWYAGTMKGRADSQGKPLKPVERYWSDISQLKSEAPEVIEALRETYDTLERGMARGRRAGNS